MLCLVIGFPVYWFLFKGNENGNDTESPVVDKKDKKDMEKEDDKKEYSLDMIMVGDALIHANVFNDAKSSNGYNFKPMFEYVSDTIKSYDLAFYNQETPFAGKDIGYSGYPSFNTPSKYGDDMLDMGFNLVSLATNHTMDKGATGAINSLEYWNSKDVLAVGSYLSLEDRNKINIKEKNNIKYTMLAYTLTTNSAIPAGKSYLLNMYDKAKATEDINKVKDQVDLLIVSMHWGDEYQLQPNARQKEIATYLASLGVDIIIGTHTHSVQPIEYIDGTLVIYSLGNFISSQLYEDNLIGLMPTLKVTKTIEDNESAIEISDLEATLIYTYYDNHRNHKVIPFDKLTSNEFTKYKTYYEKYKEVLTSMDETITVGSVNE
ncbi:MAG: CapA family protein [Bacilli bacterium]|nr:CapA family protein [Bacilli bacterium]